MSQQQNEFNDKFEEIQRQLREEHVRVVCLEQDLLHARDELDNSVINNQNKIAEMFAETEMKVKFYI